VNQAPQGPVAPDTTTVLPSLPEEQGTTVLPSVTDPTDTTVFPASWGQSGQEPDQPGRHLR
jgi:hypothetical protein